MSNKKKTTFQIWPPDDRSAEEKQQKQKPLTVIPHIHDDLDVILMPGRRYQRSPLMEFLGAAMRLGNLQQDVSQDQLEQIGNALERHNCVTWGVKGLFANKEEKLAAARLFVSQLRSIPAATSEVSHWKHPKLRKTDE